MGIGDADATGRVDASRTSCAKEVIFCLLTPGHRTSPVTHTRYSRPVGMAHTAQEAGATQVLFQAIWEYQRQPPLTGPVGRALKMSQQLG